MKTTKQKNKALDHALLMAGRNMKSYVLLSVTMIMSFALLLGFFIINSTDTYHTYGTDTTIRANVEYSHWFYSQDALDSYCVPEYCEMSEQLGAHEELFTEMLKNHGKIVPHSEYTGLYSITLNCPRSKVLYKTNSVIVGVIWYAPDTQNISYYGYMYTP